MMISLPTSFPYFYHWNRMGRKGQACAVLVRAKAMNSCLVIFEDGFTAVTSRNALRRLETQKGLRIHLQDTEANGSLNDVGSGQVTQ